MQKQVSTLTGIIIIVAVAVVAVGGVFLYLQNSQTPMTNDQSNPNVKNISTNNQKVSEQDAINSVKNLGEVKNYFTLSIKNGQQPFAEIEQIRDGYYVVWVYEIVNNEHATTYNRYDVNMDTGEINKESRP